MTAPHVGLDISRRTCGRPTRLSVILSSCSTYEKIFQNVIVVGWGQWLLAHHALQHLMSCAGLRLDPNNLIARLTPGTGEVLVMGHACKYPRMPKRVPAPHVPLYLAGSHKIMANLNLDGHSMISFSLSATFPEYCMRAAGA
jgi:hypothetical protein